MIPGARNHHLFFQEKTTTPSPRPIRDSNSSTTGPRCNQGEREAHDRSAAKAKYPATAVETIRYDLRLRFNWRNPPARSAAASITTAWFRLRATKNIQLSEIEAKVSAQENNAPNPRGHEIRPQNRCPWRWMTNRTP